MCRSCRIKKNGIKDGRQSYCCRECNHRWREHKRRQPDYRQYYRQWLCGRRTLGEIADNIGVSVPTLRNRFDNLPAAPALKPPPEGPVNLVIDATFFGRDYGYLCFHDTRRIVHFREIKTESLEDLDRGLDALTEAGYRFKSFTIDGRWGYASLLQRRFPGIPVQMCHFHQKAIVRRYITNNPKTSCGRDLKELMQDFGKQDPQDWIDRLHALHGRHRPFLTGKNDKGEYTHRRLRSAFRSLTTNLLHLFLYHEIPDAGIPNTTNCLEGAFAHLKEKIKIHRGLSKARKKKAIQYILNWT